METSRRWWISPLSGSKPSSRSRQHGMGEAIMDIGIVRHPRDWTVDEEASLATVGVRPRASSASAGDD